MPQSTIDRLIVNSPYGESAQRVGQSHPFVRLTCGSGHG